MKLIVTDLDNTLYDWVSYHANVVRSVLAWLASATNQSETSLVGELKLVNEHLRDSERPEAFLLVPSFKKVQGELPSSAASQLVAKGREVISNARRQIRLYEGVLSTFESLSARGMRIVAHTEAVADVALFRLKITGADRFISRLYALSHPELTKFNDDETIDRKSGSVNVVLVPPVERKPNHRLLLDICRQENVDPSEVLYVGDSLIKDISMANQAGVSAAWARYGVRHNPRDWDLLVSITHWNDADVKSEGEKTHMSPEVVPDVVLDRFSDLLTHVVHGVSLHSK